MLKHQGLKRILVAALLCVMLLVTLCTAIAAATTETYAMRIDYDTEACRIYVKVDEAPLSAVEGVYNVPKNHAVVEIRLEPTLGYALSPLTDTDTSSPIAPDGADGLVYTFLLTSDKNYRIEATPKTYTIKEQGAAGLSHEMTFISTTCVFRSSEYVTLPSPELSGYKFIGWKFIDDARNEIFTLNKPIEGNVVFQNGVCPKVGDTLYAIPIWEGLPMSVTRYDYEYAENGALVFVNDAAEQKTTWQEKNGTENVSGKDGNDADRANTANRFDEDGYKLYVGYEPFAKYDEILDEFDKPKYYTTLAKVKADEAANIMYRYYVPITYTLSYRNVDGVGNMGSYPTQHIYNRDTDLTALDAPEKAGFTFRGWKVYIQKDGETELTDVTRLVNTEVDVIRNLCLSARTLGLADGNANDEIVLEAVWEANTYDITYDWNGAPAADLTFMESAYPSYVFDEDLAITDPIRVGYHFLGWTVSCGGQQTDVDSENGVTVLERLLYPGDMTLTARWEAKTVEVDFDANGGDAQWNPDPIPVTFDGTLTFPQGFVHPTRVGYTFAGYALDAAGTEMYVLADGTLAPGCETWRIDEETVILYAQWEIESYEITVDIGDVEATVVIDDLSKSQQFTFPYTGEAITLLREYGTRYTVTILVEGNKKVVVWQGAPVTHTAEFVSDELTLPAEDVTLTATILSSLTVPAFTVDYVNELLVVNGGLPNGRYLITDGTVTLEVEVENGAVKIRENGGPVQNGTTIPIPESFFQSDALNQKKPITITVCGNGITNSDSDPLTLLVSSRPSRPELNNGNQEVSRVYPFEETAIIVKMKELAMYSIYEFAISENADGTDLVWLSADQLTRTDNGEVMFTRLKPGTPYWVYIRVKAVAGEAPHGEYLRVDGLSTRSAATLDAVIEELSGLKTGGPMVEELIERALDEIKSLPSPSPDFYDTLQAIYNEVLANLDFAKEQDEKISELDAFRDALLASEAFSTDGEAEINSLCDTAIASIQAAETIDVVRTAHTQGMNGMKRVSLYKLTSGNITLLAHTGLVQGTKLNQLRMSEIAALTNAVDSAIRIGTISVSGKQMTLAEAIEALKTLDVMDAYRLGLITVDATATTTGEFEIRLLLSNELRGISGLQVAYYDEKTGTLEVLDTERDGEYLVFYASRVADFVILGDPTLNLVPFIGGLSLILLCQIVAIALLLVRRMKAKRAASHYGFALPMLLTIRFFPNGGITALLILAGAVVLLQILLMYLLLTSDLFRRGKARTYEQREESIPAIAPVEEELYEELAEDADEGLIDCENHHDEEICEECHEGDPVLTSLTDEELSEDTAHYEDFEDHSEDDFFGTTFSDSCETEPRDRDDFIEPAANPRYSLPDEEYIEEEYAEDEEIVDEETLEQTDADEEIFAEDEELDETPLYNEDTAYEQDAPVWDYDNTEESVIEDASTDEDAPLWSIPETAAEWEYDGEPAESTDAEEEPEEPASEESFADEASEEEPEEEPEEEFPIVPDIRGDMAPAPDGFDGDEDGDARKKEYESYND